jgi:hypothetical protein
MADGGQQRQSADDGECERFASSGEPATCEAEGKKIL